MNWLQMAPADGAKITMQKLESDQVLPRLNPSSDFIFCSVVKSLILANHKLKKNHTRDALKR